MKESQASKSLGMPKALPIWHADEADPVLPYLREADFEVLHDGPLRSYLQLA